MVAHPRAAATSARSDLPERPTAIYDLVLGEDGYPLQRRGHDGKLVATPILGKYVMHDHLLAWEREGDRQQLNAAIAVADAVCARMDEFGGGLVFWYAGSDASTRNPERHFSGLTQSHYLVVFERLAQATGDVRFAQVARKILRSLWIPADEGGALYEHPAGRIIAETPMRPHDVILNGWLTAMVNVRDYADLTGDRSALELFDANARALASLIGLFDVPTLRNSRYSTAGFAYFRLRLPSRRDEEAPYGVAGLEVRYDGEPPLPVARLDGTRWQPHAFSADVARADAVGAFVLSGRAMRMNLLLNYLTFPAPNVVALTVDTPKAGEAILEMRRGAYNPRATSPTTSPKWVEVGRAAISAGQNAVSFSVPWELAQGVAQATNFLKVVDGRHFNVYHFLHIDLLHRIFTITGNVAFLDVAERWTGYTRAWADMPEYAAVETAPPPHRGFALPASIAADG